MSNGFKVGGNDISTYFYLNSATSYNGTSNTNNTGILFNTRDLTSLLVPYFSGIKANNSGYLANGTDISTYFTPNNGFVPTAPNKISISQSSATLSTVNISFTLPTAPNAYSGLVSNYYYPYYLNGSATNSGNATIVSNTGPVVLQFSGFSSNTFTPLTINASISNSYGAVLTGSISNSINITTIASAPTLSAPSATYSSIAFTVTAPSGNATITSYTGYALLNNSGGAVTSSNISLSGSQFTFTGLAGASSYTCYLAAVNAGGTGSYGNYTFTTLSCPPVSTPSFSTSVSSSSVTFTVSSPLGNTYNYIVNGVSSSGYVSQTSYTIGGLSSSTQYLVYVYAQNFCGNTNVNSTYVTTAAPVPTVLTFNTATTATLSFSQATIIGYVVVGGGGSSWANGGAGGGVAWCSSLSNGYSVPANTTINITVGYGGLGGGAYSLGQQGGTSSISYPGVSINATGGGGGGNTNLPTVGSASGGQFNANGGSGGSYNNGGLPGGNGPIINIPDLNLNNNYYYSGGGGGFYTGAGGLAGGGNGNSASDQAGSTPGTAPGAGGGGSPAIAGTSSGAAGLVTIYFSKVGNYTLNGAVY